MIDQNTSINRKTSVKWRISYRGSQIIRLEWLRKMDLKRLQYFETVAKVGNLTKAAEILNISQPPLSQQIHILEKDLGVKLFDRRKQGMFLTSEGFLLLEQLTPLLQQFKGLKGCISGMNPQSTASTLTIATLTGFSGILSEALFHFWHANPNICISIREGVSELVLNYVNNAKAQVGITRLPVMDNSLCYTVLGHDPIRAFLRDDDPLANKEIIMPKDLKNRLLLLIQSNIEHNGFTRIIQILEESGIRPRVVGYADTGATILQLVKRGMGIGLIANSSCVYASPGIKALPFTETTIAIPTAVVWRKEEENPMVLDAKNVIVKYCSGPSFTPANI